MPMNGWRLSFPSPAAVGNSSTRVESGSVNEAGGSDDRPALGTSQATTVNSSEKVSDLSTPSRPSIPHETVQQDKRPFIRSLVAMRWPSTSTCFTRYLGHQARSGCPTLTLKRPGLVGLFGRPSCSDPELDAGELIVPDCTVGCDGRRHHRRWPYGRHYRLDETDASTPTSSKVHLPRASLSHREASHWTGDQEHVRRPISVEKQHTTRRLSETPAGSELSRRPARVSSPCIGSEIQQRGKLAKCLAMVAIYPRSIAIAVNRRWVSCKYLTCAENRTRCGRRDDRQPNASQSRCGVDWSMDVRARAAGDRGRLHSGGGLLGLATI
jgi:hypothetical protein